MHQADFMNFTEHRNTIAIEHQQIVYYRMGEGEPILFIHGITTYSFIWRNVIPQFLDNYEVIVVDLAGCGDSSKNIDDSYSIKNHAKMLLELIDELKLDKLHLVCHDVGGGIGQIMAVHRPDQILSLTLVNAVAYDFWPVYPIISMRTPIIRQLAMASLDLGVFKFIVKRGVHKRENVNDELMNYFWKPLKTREGRKAFLYFAHCLNNNDLLEIIDQIHNLKITVLIIRGESDVFLSRKISEKLHENITGSKFVSINKGGHFIQEDEPELLAETILDFYNQMNEY